uniref:Uncharacterized protein n=1 Tax=Brassica oleracea var. oleracea TaxID=109376 RepID=A0A0D3E9T3_BRAOL
MLMSNCASVEEETKESESVAATPPKTVVVKEDDADHHPYAFHVSGPRNVLSMRMKELLHGDLCGRIAPPTPADNREAFY